MKLEERKIHLGLEKVNPQDITLELSYDKDEDNYFYLMGIASTPDVNSYGYIVENEALLKSWRDYQAKGKNVAVYEKHGLPIGKVVACEEMNGKILVVLELPKRGNQRVISVYEQGIYTGLSIGGWILDDKWEEDDVWHVIEFEWYEVSLTDIPSNENAVLLEYAKTKKEKNIKSELEKTINNVINNIKELK